MTIKTLSVLPGIGQDHPQATWYIGPVGHSRDSDLVEECNWHVVTEAYAVADPDGEDHEIHRFGHFAVGWIEEVAYRPGSKVADLADKFRARLDTYPILNEERLSEFVAVVPPLPLLTDLEDRAAKVADDGGPVLVDGLHLDEDRWSELLAAAGGNEILQLADPKKVKCVIQGRLTDAGREIK